jgi:putative FmdB family regulatory protein
MLVSAMPIYEYRCDNGHIFEVMQKMTDDPVSVCSTCEAPVQRVFHPVAVHFKGKGFYNTDYGTKRRNRELERSGKDGADKSSASSSSSSSSELSSSSSSSAEGSSSSKGSGDKKASGSSSSSAAKKKD